MSASPDQVLKTPVADMEPANTTAKEVPFFYFERLNQAPVKKGPEFLRTLYADFPWSNANLPLLTGATPLARYHWFLFGGERSWAGGLVEQNFYVFQSSNTTFLWLKLINAQILLQICGTNVETLWALANENPAYFLGSGDGKKVWAKRLATCDAFGKVYDETDCHKVGWLGPILEKAEHEFNGTLKWKN